jgi:catechol 2,3-dioxygenase-like lactoylglutathione lyase family enzyme
MPRRTILIALALLLSLSGGAPAPVVARVDSICLTVADLERSIDFYTRVLSFEKISEYESDGEAIEHLSGVFGAHTRVARLRLGDEVLELTEYLSPQGRPAPVDARSNDRWFQHVAIIVSDMSSAYETLRRHKVRHVSPSPQRLPDWNKNAGGIQAFYFRDPDGHPLEILSFPPGKGNPRWHRSCDKLFLGIDHTAIVISDTEASLKFYRDVLGFELAGESENFGPEQERLNSVFGARLRISSLRAAAGPSIEFLEYLAPRDGRPYPLDEKPNDLIHWHTRLAGGDAARAARALRQAGAAFISPDVVQLLDTRAGYRKSVLARDPDGHAIEIVEP